MSSQDVMRGIFALIISGIIAWNVYSRSVEEEEPEPEDSKRQRYLPYGSGTLLPLMFLILLGMGLVYYGPREALRLTLSVCFTIFAQITLYYLLLLPALPLLRRRFSARACAALWILPNFLYITQQEVMAQSRPLVVVSAPEALVWGLFWVWLVGALAFFLWKMIVHLRFRARLLRGSQAVQDQEVLAVWDQELAAANVRKPKFRLVTSPNTATPLSVGLFQRTIRVVLPQRPYTREELSLIFRHELVHIGREDAWNKFFLLFCTALCWFNPLMWVAMKKSAEDLGSAATRRCCWRPTRTPAADMPACCWTRRGMPGDLPPACPPRPPPCATGSGALFTHLRNGRAGCCWGWCSLSCV